MILDISKYALPGIGALCVIGAISVGVAMNKPVNVDIDGNDAAYSARTPQQPELKSNVPTMDVILEKHLFTKERKAGGANTFPDLLVKGVYVGEKCSVVLSLKSRPSVNLRIWEDNVTEVIGRITESRDPRQTLVDFLNEWDVKEITMKGLTVEHFVTGEVETYEVDYVPTKHVADNAESGYGQGTMAVAVASGTKNATQQKTTTATSAQGLIVNDLRSMMRSMSPEQRAAFAQRMGGGQGGQSGRQQGGQQSTQGSSRNSTSSSSRNSTSSSSRSSGSSSGGSSGGRSR